MTSANTATICSGGTVSIPLTASSPATYTWIATNNANVTGESTTLQTSSTLSNTLVNLTGVNQVVTYTVIPTSTPGGCPGAPQTVTVTVVPLTINAGTDTVVCGSACVNLSGTSSIAAGTFNTTFANSTTVAIPNNNTGGANTSVTSSGIVNSASSIGSICFTLNHSSLPDIGQNGNANAITITMPDGTVYNSTLTPLSGSGTQTYCIPPAVYAGYTGTLNGNFTLNVKDTRGGGGGTGSITNLQVIIATNTVSWSPTTGMTNGNTLTPTVCPTVDTTYTLTVIAPGGCIATDTVFVDYTTSPTIVLTSAIATTNQTVCINTSITNIVYTTGGGATGATFGGLPTGVSGSWVGNVVTISGTPSVAGPFNYTVTTTGGCTPAATATGVINVSNPPAVPTIATGAATCSANGTATVSNYSAALTYTSTPV
ncbi:PKD-like domain-containing protein, partial [Flavobacterium terrigena]|uniref:PKD-like domain-containing protein n=1 Tax=Flavobacterium terrigena TaxID=402734 RepID=UPI0039EED4DD